MGKFKLKKDKFDFGNKGEFNFNKKNDYSKTNNYKADSHASSEPSIEEQLKLRNNNKKLKDQCAKSGGTWNAKKGVCVKKQQDSKYSDLEKYDDDRG